MSQDESVVSYFMTIQERLTEMVDLVKENVVKAQAEQKRCMIITRDNRCCLLKENKCYCRYLP